MTSRPRLYAQAAHPRAAQCAFWDKLDCKLGGCLKGIQLQGECDTAQLLCSPKAP
jgi:hypothetical protein